MSVVAATDRDEKAFRSEESLCVFSGSPSVENPNRRLLGYGKFHLDLDRIAALEADDHADVDERDSRSENMVMVAALLLRCTNRDETLLSCIGMKLLAESIEMFELAGSLLSLSRFNPLALFLAADVATTAPTRWCCA